MKNNYLNTSSFRKRNIQKKLTSLSIRIEKAIKNGRFRKFTQKKQAKIIRRLQRYSKQLNINLSLGLRTALVGAGLLLFSQASAQITFAEQTGANNPFDGVDIGDKSSPTFVDIDNDGGFDAFFVEAPRLRDGLLGLDDFTGVPLQLELYSSCSTSYEE